MNRYLEQSIRRLVTDCVERYATDLRFVPLPRKPIVVANWKMNMSLHDALQYVNDFDSFQRDIDVVICPPNPFLFPMNQLIVTLRKNFDLGAQNMHWNEAGAHTGDVSGSMLRQVGCRYVILGHSERRAAGETDEHIHRKVVSAIASDLIPILCVGESAEERESGRTVDVIRRQLTVAMQDLTDLSKMIIAYEPVWAIGTGQPATASYAQNVHAQIREIIGRFSDSSAGKVRLLYGGSVKADHASEYSSMQDIDGVLVGSSSLSVSEFYAIIQSFEVKAGGQ